MPDYEDWISFHVQSFGVPYNAVPNDAAGWSATLALWLETFRARGYTAEELMEATREITASSLPLGKVADHRAAIDSVIKSRRSIALRQQVADSEVDRGTCTLCGNTGFVTVPHLRGIKNGQWEWIKPYRHRSTQAVLCRCIIGTARAARGHKSMTLDAYEQLNPSWQDQMDLDAEERRQQQQAGPVDGRFSEALRRVIARTQQRQDDEPPF